ncbi:hypothetical protein HT031_003069 [Scenedesmus sp. PABB004]|nr:hypothetical protein HT031_003069 [Scenedesmus sp. PABB004]
MRLKLPHPRLIALVLALVAAGACRPAHGASSTISGRSLAIPAGGPGGQPGRHARAQQEQQLPAVPAPPAPPPLLGHHGAYRQEVTEQGLEYAAPPAARLPARGGGGGGARRLKQEAPALCGKLGTYVPNYFTEQGSMFGLSLASNADASLVAAGAPLNSPNVTSPGGALLLTSLNAKTCEYRARPLWQPRDSYRYFGAQVALSEDGTTMAVMDGVEAVRGRPNCTTPRLCIVNTTAAGNRPVVHVYKAVAGEGFKYLQSLAVEVRAAMAAAMAVSVFYWDPKAWRYSFIQDLALLNMPAGARSNAAAQRGVGGGGPARGPGARGPGARGARARRRRANARRRAAAGISVHFGASSAVTSDAQTIAVSTASYANQLAKYTYLYKRDPATDRFRIVSSIANGEAWSDPWPAATAQGVNVDNGLAITQSGKFLMRVEAGRLVVYEAQGAGMTTTWLRRCQIAAPPGYNYRMSARRGARAARHAPRRAARAAPAPAERAPPRRWRRRRAGAASMSIVEAGPVMVKLAIGAYVGDLAGAPEQMAVFLYYLDGPKDGSCPWRPAEKHTHADPFSNYGAGVSLSANGKLLAVGAPTAWDSNMDNQTGAVYMIDVSSVEDDGLVAKTVTLPVNAKAGCVNGRDANGNACVDKQFGEPLCKDVKTLDGTIIHYGPPGCAPTPPPPSFWTASLPPSDGGPPAPGLFRTSSVSAYSSVAPSIKGGVGVPVGQNTWLANQAKAAAQASYFGVPTTAISNPKESVVSAAGWPSSVTAALGGLPPPSGGSAVAPSVSARSVLSGLGAVLGGLTKGPGAGGAVPAMIPGAGGGRTTTGLGLPGGGVITNAGVLSGGAGGGGGAVPAGLPPEALGGIHQPASAMGSTRPTVARRRRRVAALWAALACLIQGPGRTFCQDQGSNAVAPSAYVQPLYVCKMEVSQLPEYDGYVTPEMQAASLGLRASLEGMLAPWFIADNNGDPNWIEQDYEDTTAGTSGDSSSSSGGGGGGGSAAAAPEPAPLPGPAAASRPPGGRRPRSGGRGRQRPGQARAGAPERGGGGAGGGRGWQGGAARAPKQPPPPPPPPPAGWGSTLIIPRPAAEVSTASVPAGGGVGVASVGPGDAAALELDPVLVAAAARAAGQPAPEAAADGPAGPPWQKRQRQGQQPEELQPEEPLPEEQLPEEQQSEQQQSEQQSEQQQQQQQTSAQAAGRAQPPRARRRLQQAGGPSPGRSVCNKGTPTPVEPPNPVKYSFNATFGQVGITMSSTNVVPPDATIAVGPAHALHVVNSLVSIIPLTPSGGIDLSPRSPGQRRLIPLPDWFGLVASPCTGGYIYPAATYDKLIGRFLLTAICGYDSNQVMLAVSTGPSATGTWLLFSFPGEVTQRTPMACGGYPVSLQSQVSYNQDGVFLSFVQNCPDNQETATGAILFALPKWAVYKGATWFYGPVWTAWDIYNATGQLNTEALYPGAFLQLQPALPQRAADVQAEVAYWVSDNLNYLFPLQRTEMTVVALINTGSLWLYEGPNSPSPAPLLVSRVIGRGQSCLAVPSTKLVQPIQQYGPGVAPIPADQCQLLDAGAMRPPGLWDGGAALYANTLYIADRGPDLVSTSYDVWGDNITLPSIYWAELTPSFCVSGPCAPWFGTDWGWDDGWSWATGTWASDSDRGKAGYTDPSYYNQASHRRRRRRPSGAQVFLYPGDSLAASQDFHGRRLLRGEPDAQQAFFDGGGGAPAQAAPGGAPAADAGAPLGRDAAGVPYASPAALRDSLIATSVYASLGPVRSREALADALGAALARMEAGRPSAEAPPPPPAPPLHSAALVGVASANDAAYGGLLGGPRAAQFAAAGGAPNATRPLGAAAARAAPAAAPPAGGSGGGSGGGASVSNIFLGASAGAPIGGWRGFTGWGYDSGANYFGYYDYWREHFFLRNLYMNLRDNPCKYYKDWAIDNEITFGAIVSRRGVLEYVTNQANPVGVAYPAVAVVGGSMLVIFSFSGPAGLPDTDGAPLAYPGVGFTFIPPDGQNGNYEIAYAKVPGAEPNAGCIRQFGMPQWGYSGADVHPGGTRVLSAVESAYGQRDTDGANSNAATWITVFT